MVQSAMKVVYEVQVFLTCGTSEKKQFLLRSFPSLTEGLYYKLT